jgi:hypothetical protein
MRGPRPDSRGGDGSVHRSAEPSPGRRTLTQRVQRSRRDPNGVAADAGDAVASAADSAGQPLPDALRGKFESSLGADLSGVRVHHGSPSADAADAVGARAFAVGQDVHFAAGEYDPDSGAGQRLLAHEVAHTVQQAGGVAASPQPTLEVSSPGDAHEQEAEAAADQMVAGAPARVSTGAAVVARDPNPQTTATPGGSTPTPASGERESRTWRDIGNLRGAPPVRSEESPPNKAIIEDAATYGERHAAAQATRGDQEARAQGMLDEAGKVQDQRYWFTKVYQFVTEGEIQCAEERTFFYPSYVLQCVRYFHQIYENNLDAAANGGQVEEHWRRAWEVAANEHSTTLVSALGVLGAGALGLGGIGAGIGLSVTGHPVEGVAAAAAGIVSASMVRQLVRATESLVASMQAHIRFDLPRAEAWVFNSYYANQRPDDGSNKVDYHPARMQDFQPDFMSMTRVFDQAATRMNREMAQRIGIPPALMTTLMPRLVQDWAMTNMMDANMATERADTWRRAEALVSEGKAGTDPYRDQGGQLTGDVTTTQQPAGTGLGSLSDPSLRPTMDSSAEYDDDTARDQTAAGGLERKSTTERTRMLRALQSGATFNDDENSILEILRASITVGDVVTVIDGANAWDLMYATDGAQKRQLRTLFRAHYYSRTSQSEAITLIRRCMDGETAEWEEEMVADILVDRHGSDGRAIVTAIGRHYDGGGFAEGVNKIQWQLDGEDQRRFDRLYDP